MILYDNMLKLNPRYMSELDYKGGNVTIKDQLNEISSLTGLSIDYSNFHDHVLNKKVVWYDNTLSMRNHIGWIAEIAGCNVSINSFGVVVFKEINPYFDFETERVGDYEIEEVWKVSRVCFNNGLVLYEKGNKTNNTLYISENNPYCDEQSLVDYIYNKYNGLTLMGVSKIKMRGIRNLRLGDVVKYNSIHFIVLSLTANEFGGESYPIYEINGKLPTKNEEIAENRIDTSVKIRRLQVLYDQNEAALNILTQDVEDNSEKIGELELTTEGFKVSISETETKVEEIEKRVTVTSISSQYGISSDKEIAPTSWLDDRPDISEGQYLWMREKYLYSNNTVKYDGVRMISAENGKDADAPLSEKTVEGNNVTITDSNDSYDIEITKMYGKSEQFTTNGYQLFDASKLATISKGGATITNNGDGSFTVSGSGVLSEICGIQYSYTHEETVKLLKNGILRCNGYNSGVIFPTFQIYLMNGSTVVGIPSLNDVTITQEMLDNTDFFMRINFYGKSGSTIISGTIKPMLYQDGDGTWEPFTGGIPSPNPDYPQEIKCVENPVVNVRGKNLIPYPYKDGSSITTSGVTFTVSEDGTISASGTSTKGLNYTLTAPSMHLPKGTYTLSGMKNMKGITLRVRDNANSYTMAVLYEGQESVTFTTVEDYETVYIYLNQGYADVSISGYCKPQLEIGSVATDFEPYQGQTSTIPITLNAIPVSSGGNVIVDGQQYIADYVDIERKKLVRNVGAVDLGTLNYNIGYFGSNTFSSPLTGTNLSQTVCKGLCSHYIYSDYSSRHNSLCWTFRTDTDNFIVHDTNYTDVATFKQAMQGVKLLYELATPIEINLTDEQLQAFKLPSYYPTTNVFIDSEVEPSKTCFHYYTIFKGTYGDAGTSVENIIPEFYLSTSKTTQEGGSWSTVAPEWSSGKYLWTRNKILYKDPYSIEYTTPVCDSSWEAANETADELNKKIDKTKLSVTAEYSSAIKTVKDEIDLRVGTVETIVSEDGKKITDLETKLSVTDQLVQITKSTTETLQSAIDGKVSQEELEEYVRFDGAKVEIGKSDSLFKTVITNEELAFYQGDYKVAWISNNELHVTNAIITTAIGVGKFIFKDEGDSGFSLMIS